MAGMMNRSSSPKNKNGNGMSRSWCSLLVVGLLCGVMLMREMTMLSMMSPEIFYSLSVDSATVLLPWNYSLPTATVSKNDSPLALQVNHETGIMMKEQERGLLLQRGANESMEALMHACHKVNATNPYGPYCALQFLDKGYINITKHWVCNVRRFPSVLSVTVFVATDWESYEAVSGWGEDVHVVLFPFTPSSTSVELSYGQIAYFMFMRFRTGILSDMLRRGQSFFLIESDAYWAEDVFQKISDLKLFDRLDMVSADDSAAAKRFQGGFHWNRASTASVAIWDALHNKISKVLQEEHAKHSNRSATYIGESGSEQIMMEKVMKELRPSTGHKMKFLSPDFVASGQWYTQGAVRKKYPNPSVVLFNFIIGNDAKVLRARQNGQYFLDRANNECVAFSNLTSSIGALVTRARQFRKKKDVKRFSVIVLTMNRPKSLERLLLSLDASYYDGDRIDLTIRIDKAPDNAGVLAVAMSFDWIHGSKTIHIENHHLGLAMSWFTAWQPANDDERVCIFEDDVEVSPAWYFYIRSAWVVYKNRDDMAGVTLQRQNLVARKRRGVNHITSIRNQYPFLYALVGSRGFSPHPQVWKAFTEWLGDDPLGKKVDVANLITTQWYKSNSFEVGHMWTQHFIFFCNRHDLFTLYINFPDEIALCSHWSEKGVHNVDENITNPTIDFRLAQPADVALDFLMEPKKFDWDATELVATAEGSNKDTNDSAGNAKLIIRAPKPKIIRPTTSKDSAGVGKLENDVDWKKLVLAHGQKGGGDEDQSPVVSLLPVEQAHLSSDQRSLILQAQKDMNIVNTTDEKTKEIVANSTKERIKPIIAIIAPTRSIPGWQGVQDSKLQTFLLPSLQVSVTTQETKDWDIRLYIAVDDDDDFWMRDNMTQWHSLRIPSYLTVHVHAFPSIPNRIPFNEITAVAYNDGAEYFCRINDDSAFVSFHWITDAVNVMLSYDPPNLGVVGPKTKGDKTSILTHDFVHRTHMQIFDGVYYPSVFHNWYLDDWITTVYSITVLGPKFHRSTKMKDWKVLHQSHNQRYSEATESRKLLPEIYAKGFRSIRGYIENNYPNHTQLLWNFTGVKLKSHSPMDASVVPTA